MKAVQDTVRHDIVASVELLSNSKITSQVTRIGYNGIGGPIWDKMEFPIWNEIQNQVCEDLGIF